MRFSLRSSNRAVHPVLVWLALVCFLPALFYDDGARRAVDAVQDHCASLHMQASHIIGQAHSSEDTFPSGEPPRETEDTPCGSAHCLLCVVPGLPASLVLLVPDLSTLPPYREPLPAGQPRVAPDKRHAPSHAPPASFA
jgi:hypothetical protein